jgi:hypothetical protein
VCKRNSAKSLRYTSNVYKYVVSSFVFKGEESGLVFFDYKQKAAYVLV